MSNLAKQMNDLTEYVTTVMERNAGATDPHLQTCHDTADQFKLWDDTDSFPLWLSFVVAGIGRDLGILM